MVSDRFECDDALRSSDRDPDEMLAGSLGSSANVKQKRREAQCALNLAAKLAPLLVGVGSMSSPAATGSRENEYMDEVEQLSPQVNVDGAMAMDEFLVAEQEEAQELGGQPFGATLLHTIGIIYTLKAEQWLGANSTFLGIGGAKANIKQRHHTAKTHVAAAQAAWGAMKAARALDAFDEDLEEGSVSTQAISILHPQFLMQQQKTNTIVSSTISDRFIVASGTGEGT